MGPTRAGLVLKRCFGFAFLVPMSIIPRSLATSPQDSPREDERRISCVVPEQDAPCQSTVQSSANSRQHKVSC